MVDGWDSSQNKTLPRKQERNEASCVAETRVVAVPVVVEPVPVEDHLVTILVEIRDIEVAVAVPHNTCKAPSVPPPFEYSQG